MDCELKNCFKGLLWGALLCLAITLLCGCKTKQATECVPAPEYHFADTSKMAWRTDSVYLRDSVYVSQYVKGDTVYLTKSLTKYKCRDRFIRDTLTVVRRDSVPYPVEKKVVEYKYRQRWYEAVACKLGYAVGIFLASALIVWLIKRKTQ